MRVIAGKYGGRLFVAPRGHRTHPMSDRIRSALFNSLGDMTDLAVLDAFAGSGALGIESLSRGAKLAVLVDSDKKAYRAIKQNIESLKLEETCRAVRANVSSWSSNNSEEKFDIIYADPPYNHLQILIIDKLVTHLDTNGTFILSWPSDEDLPRMAGFRIYKRKTYGIVQVVFYEHASYQANKTA